MKPRRTSPAFFYRSGIGMSRTHVTCDGIGFTDDLLFLSNAHALGPRDISLLTSHKAGRRQIVTTEKTLRQLGDAGKKLRSNALPAAFGRPFNLGEFRLELFPNGHLPGSASLLCEDKNRRLVFFGPYCPDSLVEGIEAAEVRHANAICIDATYGDPRLDIPPRAQAVAQVRAFVQASFDAGQIPVLLVSPFGSLPFIASDLAAARIPLRAHPRIAMALSNLRSMCQGLPLAKRFAGKVAKGEVLLWLPEARDAAFLHTEKDLRLALVSGAAATPDVLVRMRIEHGFPLTNLPNFSEILTIIEATGAKEVALFHGAAETLTEFLRQRGLDAYVLGPPRQMTLPGW
jgi:putative mRNA 3-end processing factor